MPVVFDVVYLTSVRFWSLQKWDQKVNNRTTRWPNTKVMLYCLGQIWCLPLVFSDELKWKPRVVMINLIATKLSTLKLVYSEKATLFCEISTLLLSIIHTDKSKVEILQSFMAFSEYMNFNYAQLQWTFISIYFSWAENSTAKMTSTSFRGLPDLLSSAYDEKKSSLGIEQPSSDDISPAITFQVSVSSFPQQWGNFFSEGA